jgi:hypothetical protein
LDGFRGSMMMTVRYHEDRVCRVKAKTSRKLSYSKDAG